MRKMSSDFDKLSLRVHEGSRWASQVVQVVKNLPANAGRLVDPFPVPGRCSGEGHGNPLQYHCLENPMDRGAWR